MVRSDAISCSCAPWDDQARRHALERGQAVIISITSRFDLRMT